MTHDARLAYEKVLKNQARLDSEFVDKLINQSLSGKSAAESAQAFIEAGFKPIEKNVNKLPKKWGWIVGGVVAAATTIVALVTGKKPETDEVVQALQQAA